MCENYFQPMNEKVFWEEFKGLHATNKEYIPSIASNTITCKCIKFPIINNADQFNYFFQSNNSNAVDWIKFEDCEFITELDLSPFYKVKNLSFSNCIFQGKVNLSLPNLLILNIEDSIFYSDFLLKNFDTSKEGKKLKIKNTVFNSMLKLHNCILENSTWFNVDFLKATLEFKSSNFEGLKLNEIFWTDKISASRDTFRQLKVLMENQKNFINSNLFYSLELNEYSKELSRSRFFSHFEDKFLFLFSKISSNFTRSWSLPLLWLILFSVILYFSLYHFNYINTCNINDFIHFFNPLSKSASSKFENIYAIWFLHKIISAFFVYQIVVALKRKTRF